MCGLENSIIVSENPAKLCNTWLVQSLLDHSNNMWAFVSYFLCAKFKKFNLFEKKKKQNFSYATDVTYWTVLLYNTIQYIQRHTRIPAQFISMGKQIIISIEEFFRLSIRFNKKYYYTWNGFLKNMAHVFIENKKKTIWLTLLLGQVLAEALQHRSQIRGRDVSAIVFVKDL